MIKKAKNGRKTTTLLRIPVLKIVRQTGAFRKNVLIAFILIIACAGGLAWYQTTPRTFLVTKVVDGDTIDLADGRTIRYLNIDTPELAKGQVADECFAVKAKEMNEKLVLGKKVRLEMDENEMDRFGRILAYVYLDDLFVNQYLLAEGAAIYQLDTVNLKHTETLVTAADQAHKQKKGLWQECAPDPEIGCLVKGNLDRLDQRRYHLPHFRHYPQVVINYQTGDRWFCSEEEAIKAGFEKARG